ncbi:MAG: TylF/MycF/NovP-related O-methyltransferase [Alphaproteobacteria bacterium]
MGEAYAFLQKIAQIHSRAPIERHLEILYGEAEVAGLAFLSVFRDAIERSHTGLPAWKVLRRTGRALTLAQYFHATREVEGASAECGVLAGFSTLLLCRLARHLESDFRGAGLHLIDSFEGLSAPVPQDAISSLKRPGGAVEYTMSHQAGDLAAPIEHVKSVLQDYPEIDFHKGWIPEVFETLPETRWSFVHIDVDLYAPTLAALEYFYPRLSPGGVIVNDDYASPSFPGGGKAWDEFMTRHDLPFVALDTGQSVIIKA